MPIRSHNHNKYSRSVEQIGSVTPLLGVPVGSKIHLELSPDHKRVLDFSFLSDHPQLQKAFIETFRLHGENIAPITKVSQFQALKNFAVFLKKYEEKNQGPCHETNDIDNNLLFNFKFWFETRISSNDADKGKVQDEIKHAATDDMLSRRTAVDSYNTFITLLKKARSYHPEWFSMLPAKLPRLIRRKSEFRPADDVLSVEDLKRILASAKCETDRIRLQYEQIEKILMDTKTLPILPMSTTRPFGYWTKLENAVHTLIRENGIFTPFSSKLNLSLPRCHHTCPKKLLGMYIPVAEGALLPFAIQLYIMTALNVTSLVTLTRDCVEPFPLPQYRKLIYDKPRSGIRRAKSQLLPAQGMDSDAAGGESPIKVIEFLIKWTQPLAEHAPNHLKNYLFLYRTGNLGAGSHQAVKLVSKYSAFEFSLPDFISRYRESHQLPKFRLKDLRPAVATYLYLQTRNIFRVQRFLGHKQIKTTIEYIRGRVVDAEHDKNMADAIGQMIRRILPERGEPITATGKQVLSIPIPASAVEAENKVYLSGTIKREDAALIKETGVLTLVARCRQPYNPPEFLKVPKGQICTKINKCLTCPNAVILEEDLPYLLLRIREIWEERKRLSEAGWQILYADTWLLLNQAVQLFSKEAIERAISRMNTGLLISE